MLNHVRTLLLNRDGDKSPGPTFYGEEYVPVEYRAVGVSTPIANVRRVLFGENPDRAMLNYRLRQLLTLIHDTELEEYVLAMDPRVTYLPFDLRLFSAAFGVTASAPGLWVSGEQERENGDGRMLVEWGVTAVNTNVVEVVRETPPMSATTTTVSWTDGLSQLIPLQGSALRFRIVESPVGTTWRISQFRRPGLDLGVAAAKLRTLGEPTLLQIFGTGGEPYRTFRNLWQHHDQLAHSLGGLVMAMAYRMEELRVRGVA